MAPENRRYSPKESSPPTVYKMVHTFSPQNGDFSGETFLAMGDLLCEGRYIMVEALICSQQLQKAPLKTENSCHSYVCLTRPQLLLVQVAQPLRFDARLGPGGALCNCFQYCEICPLTPRRLRISHPFLGLVPLHLHTSQQAI